MNWTERDKNLFTIVNQSGNYHLEKQIQNASDTFITLKEKPSFYIIFGYYNLGKNTFVWQNDMNKISYDVVKKEYMELFGTHTTLKKLIKNEVYFEKKDMFVIPYLMEALNKDFNVVRFKSLTNYVYALTSIEGIKKTFNLWIFEKTLYYYRNWDKFEKINKKIERKSDKIKKILAN